MGGRIPRAGLPAQSVLRFAGLRLAEPLAGVANVGVRRGGVDLLQAPLGVVDLGHGRRAHQFEPLGVQQLERVEVAAGHAQQRVVRGQAQVAALTRPRVDRQLVPVTEKAVPRVRHHVDRLLGSELAERAQVVEHLLRVLTHPVDGAVYGLVRVIVFQREAQEMAQFERRQLGADLRGRERIQAQLAQRWPVVRHVVVIGARQQFHALDDVRHDPQRHVHAAVHARLGVQVEVARDVARRVDLAGQLGGQRGHGARAQFDVLDVDRVLEAAAGCDPVATGFHVVGAMALAAVDHPVDPVVQAPVAELDASLAVGVHRLAVVVQRHERELGRHDRAGLVEDPILQVRGRIHDDVDHVGAAGRHLDSHRGAHDAARAPDQQPGAGRQVHFVASVALAAGADVGARVVEHSQPRGVLEIGGRDRFVRRERLRFVRIPQREDLGAGQGATEAGVQDAAGDLSGRDLLLLEHGLRDRRHVALADHEVARVAVDPVLIAGVVVVRGVQARQPRARHERGRRREQRDEQFRRPTIAVELGAHVRDRAVLRLDFGQLRFDVALRDALQHRQRDPLLDQVEDLARVEVGFQLVSAVRIGQPGEHDSVLTGVGLRLALREDPVADVLADAAEPVER